MAAARQKHIPVMLKEVLTYLQPKAGEIYVDATFGNGGYTQAILDAAPCKVIALDRDPNVMVRANEFKNLYDSRFEFRAGKFGDFAKLVPERIGGAVFDIGVSSMQLDNAERGFSFAKEAELDMRMSCEGESAKDIVNFYGEKELADILYQYGEERKSRQIAARIAEYRRRKKIETTTELAEIVYTVIHKHAGEIDPATRTFQALRIAVNDELGELERGLRGATNRLISGGRLVVVDFHSLEDRIVKNAFRETDQVKVVTRKPIVAADEEVERNPRARSAKLRIAEKID